MKKILILGATGAMATYLIPALLPHASWTDGYSARGRDGLSGNDDLGG